MVQYIISRHIPFMGLSLGLVLELGGRMATARAHLRCPVCGSSRGPRAFGFDEEWEPDESAPPFVEPAVTICHYGGRASTRWEFQDLPRRIAILLRPRIVAALGAIDTLIECED